MAFIALSVTVQLINPVTGPDTQRVLKREVGTAMFGVIEDIGTGARQRAPVGVSGILRGSIGTRLVPNVDASLLVQGEVFTGSQAPYAIFVEEGTRPHFPPRAPLELWAARVLGDARLWFVVARAIARRGTRARYFMRDAFEAIRPTIESRLRAGSDRAMLLLNRGML